MGRPLSRTPIVLAVDQEEEGWCEQVGWGTGHALTPEVSSVSARKEGRVITPDAVIYHKHNVNKWGFLDQTSATFSRISPFHPHSRAA